MIFRHTRHFVKNKSRHFVKSKSRRFVKNKSRRFVKNKSRRFVKNKKNTRKTLRGGNPELSILRIQDNSVFDNLNNIDNTQEIELIGDSTNGFIIGLHFNGSRKAVLKCTKDTTADNLVYEYLVGKLFLNKFILKLPFFLETYHLYKFKSEYYYSELKENFVYDVDAEIKKRSSLESSISSDSSNSSRSSGSSGSSVSSNSSRSSGSSRSSDSSNSSRSSGSSGSTTSADETITSLSTHGVAEMLEVMDTDNMDERIDESCSTPTQYCILIEYLEPSRMISFKDMFIKPAYEDDRFNALYQLYFALSYLNKSDKSYSHNDLHGNNAYLYKILDEDKHFTMKMIRGQNVVVEFDTRYVVKVIDYGHNHIEDKDVSTEKIVDTVCSTQSCGNDCGKEKGYMIISGSKGFEKDFELEGEQSKNKEEWVKDEIAKYGWVDPVKKNVSIDLRSSIRGTKWIKETLIEMQTPSSEKFNLQYLDQDGTPNDEGGNPEEGNIRSIFDMCEYLEKYVVNEYNRKHPKTSTKIGEIIIYDDGRPFEIR